VPSSSATQEQSFILTLQKNSRKEGQETGFHAHRAKALVEPKLSSKKKKYIRIVDLLLAKYFSKDDNTLPRKNEKVLDSSCRSRDVLVSDFERLRPFRR
jgi:hypothetical protein